MIVRESQGLSNYKMIAQDLNVSDTTILRQLDLANQGQEAEKRLRTNPERREKPTSVGYNRPLGTLQDGHQSILPDGGRAPLTPSISHDTSIGLQRCQDPDHEHVQERVNRIQGSEATLEDPV
jgi:hypothetical protein